MVPVRGDLHATGAGRQGFVPAFDVRPGVEPDLDEASGADCQGLDPARVSQGNVLSAAAAFETKRSIAGPVLTKTAETFNKGSPRVTKPPATGRAREASRGLDDEPREWPVLRAAGARRQLNLARNPPASAVGRNRVTCSLDSLTPIVYNARMKLVVQTQLIPDADQAAKLRSAVERFNEAANWLAGVAFERRLSNRIELQRLTYKDVRERFGLSAQMTCLCIRRVCEAYKRDKNIRPKFRPFAAMPFDQRTMSFKGLDRVSLLTLDGRVVVPFLVGQYHADRLAMPKGQCDLVRRKDGKWFLIVTVDVPEATPIPATDFIGVDLGIVNIGTTSDGDTFSGADVDRTRTKHNKQRKRLQRKGTKGAKKKLKRVRANEARFRRHENHVISKTIVETAKRTERGIAVEDLSGIRGRVTARGGDARNRLSGWSFFQLFSFLAYKSTLAGVPIVTVDPRNTSRTCAECGHCEKANRKSQGEFSCRSCGHRANADQNAARNIRSRALAASKSAIELDSPRG
jgi:putative transposase